ncbi:ribonuclease E inhibitor RraA/Dimethylmenaquinone methyltransferase [Piptocephalis cylindrospora]|uniref:Ribonuclease E inhibitor RraA/Dimethylmenaquinone methyltransferase n=1 Tax=Piptocephalis cylindrospora TaxID=1907219 RepID=A0A4P9Y6S7_9FUNG|nr:ribonuclease E inhibitor RraA/Dimethylmenaquinone methyltransferase [Piptocephalis cylindrospora]|eukprot:RKP14512.1 ribonuclease E inhibitor RraA/Dimethylmenaquinone methyltransferase [Piptocephalis cylindrospora]
MSEDNNGRALGQYASCDVADAMRKLGKIGYLPGIKSFSKEGEVQKFVGPVYPVKFVHANVLPEVPTIQGHYMDNPPKGSVVLVSAPDDAYNAVLGGLVVKRAKNIGITGCVISGLVRDTEELHELGLPVFARGTSCLGAGGFVRCISRDEPIDMVIGSGPYATTLTIQPGDIVLADVDGVVVCPKEDVDRVIKECEEIVQADSRVSSALDLEDLNLSEAFAKYR